MTPPRHPLLILASSSPRRRSLIACFALPFLVDMPETEEMVLPGEEAPGHVRRLAVEKGADVANRHGEGLVVSADTVVVLDGEIIGKPRDANDAREMLGRLAGRTHNVLSGVAVTEAETKSVKAAVVSSRVTIAALAESEIDRYVATGEPLDKAGSYAAQGEGRRFITGVDGSWTNVVGLPMEELQRLLASFGCTAAPGKVRP